MNILLIIIYIVIHLIQNVFTFNLSPIPSYNFSEPNLKFLKSKEKSSYFGYQINLRKSSVIISAPRAQSTLQSQKGYNEPGSLYKCFIHESKCIPFVVDDSDGYTNVEGYNMQNKSHQWMGAAMDGDSDDNDLLVVCAPNILTSDSYDYYYHGKCYLIENFFRTQIKQFQPLAHPEHQTRSYTINGKKLSLPNFYYGQMGISVQIKRTLSDYTILIGAPGVYTHCGSVIRWKSHTNRKINNLINAFEQFDVSDPYFLRSNSYFGYAVAIGNFFSDKQVAYAASAPREGWVQLFTFQENTRNLKNYYHHLRTIDKQLWGNQLGEYYGYALLAEDFNNDKLSDLAVGAPFYSKKGTNDNGKVYIYSCNSLKCKYESSLFSNYDGDGRFGMAFAKIGDINRDGFNDLAVGAPYEENGKVYIFLGSRTGLSTTPSQIISAPDNKISTFGLGLSKGVDIDGNEFNDLVIGAPESDIVYVYKSYPVINIMVLISPKSDKVKLTESETTFTVCASYSSSHYNLKRKIPIVMTINLDPQLGRMTFYDTTKRIDIIDMRISRVVYGTCKEYRVHLNHAAAIQTPFVIQASFQLKNDFNRMMAFCSDCVAVNPNEHSVVQNRIAITSGCSHEKWCMANLSIKNNISDNNRLKYTLGKPESITIEYTIKNAGETAYFPRILIHLSQPAQFAKVLPNCYNNETTLNCQLMNSIPLYRTNETKFILSITPIDLGGDKLVIEAIASSSSNETHPYDNKIINTIDLVEFNVIEIIGKSKPTQISIIKADLVPQLNISHEFEIINYGYSIMKAITFTVKIPKIYNHTYNLVETYKLDTDRYEIRSADETNNDHHMAVSDLYDADLNVEAHHRSRRETIDNVITEALENRIVYIPRHRSRDFNCSKNFESEDCITASVKFNNFRPKEKFKVILDITLNFEYLTDILNKDYNILLFEVIPVLEKANDPQMKTFNLTIMNTLTAIELLEKGKTPVAWIIIAIVVGVLVLGGIIYWFKQMGFFQRALRQEITQIRDETALLHETMAQRDSMKLSNPGASDEIEQS